MTIRVPALRAIITVQAEYKPGDLPPEGYLAWHEWAEVQRKAGIRQRQCPGCGLWRTPQELSTREITWEATIKSGKRRGERVRLSDFLCTKCAEKEPAP